MANGNTAARQTSDDVPMLLPPLPPSLASHPRYFTQTTFWICKIHSSSLRGWSYYVIMRCYAWRPRGPYAGNVATWLFPHTESSFLHQNRAAIDLRMSIIARFDFIFYIYILRHICSIRSCIFNTCTTHSPNIKRTVYCLSFRAT